MSHVFVGLVTHARSTFNRDGASAAQAGLLADALRERGVMVDVLISDRDDYSEEQFPLSRVDLIRSAVHVADLEYRWRRFVAEGGGQPRHSPVVDAGLLLAMAVKRGAQADLRTAIRLLNIDLSHLRVMEAALASGAQWALILEDDARVSSLPDTADSMLCVTDLVAASPVQFVVLSESLPLAQLGVDGIVGGRAFTGGPEWLHSASLPVTNTVCANLYRASFLRQLVDGIRRDGLVPVVPIDWRVNEQIMRLWRAGVLDRESCVWARPGLFIQGSMHDSVG